MRAEVGQHQRRSDIGAAGSDQQHAAQTRAAQEQAAQQRAAHEQSAQPRTTQQPAARERAAYWSATFSLAASGVVLVMLAAIAAWLSFQAQSSYVLAHNGGSLTQARAWAVLLDAATAGVSLLRLHDALTGCGAIWATRLVLAGCITASVTMNLLHTVCRTFGGLLVAGVPPVLYAVLLELLLTKVTQLLLPDRRGATAAKLRQDG